MKRKTKLALLRPLLILGVLLLGIWIAIAQPSFRKNAAAQVRVDPVRLQAHVVTLTEIYPRSDQDVTNLNRCAAYIAGQFTNAGAQVGIQTFPLGSNEYRNVIGVFNRGKGNTLVIGAHYDACGLTHGADDNASGVAVLLELAGLLGQHALDREIELVAYTLEEPPNFGSCAMGSAVHAKRLAKENRPIAGVMVLDMVGYYSDERGSQSYPAPLFGLFYPSRGNYVSVVSRWDQGAWIKKIKAGMQGATDLPVYSARAPAAVQGIDFSDHRNYWPYGIPAVLITDTAICRYNQYHKPGDTFEKLDYVRLSKVAVALYAAIQTL